MSEIAKHWIDGEWTGSGTVSESVNPATGAVLGRWAAINDGFAAVGPPAQHRSGSGVDRLRDRPGTGPFTVDPVLGDLAHVRAPSAIRER